MGRALLDRHGVEVVQVVDEGVVEHVASRLQLTAVAVAKGVVAGVGCAQSCFGGTLPRPLRTPPSIWTANPPS